MAVFGTIWDTLNNFAGYLKSKGNNSVNGHDYFEEGYDLDINGKPISGTGDNNIDDVISADTESVITGTPSEDIISNQNISDAFSYGNLKGKSVEEQLEWLVDNDPDNRTSWIEALLGLQAGRENTTDARAWEKAMSDTRIQRTAKDLEAAGINPILAYQYLTGSSSSVSTADALSSDASKNEISRGTNSESGLYGLGKSAIAVIGLIISALIRKKR